MTEPPSSLALSSRPDRRLRFGLFQVGVAYAYQNEILLGMHEELSAHGVDLFCFSGEGFGAIEPVRQKNWLYDLIGPHDLDAIIAASGTFTGEIPEPTLLEFFRRYAPTPICNIGYLLNGIPSVFVDNVGAVRELTGHLIEAHGRRRIAFVGPGSGSREAEQRLLGYQAALADHGLPLDPELVILKGNFTREPGLDAVETLIGRGRDTCDAIVAANDWMAIGVLEALDRLGMRVPEDVAVIGFDDVDEARFVAPPLTTISQPIRRMGMEAARLALKQARGLPAESSVVLKTQLQFRRSCGCFHRRYEPRRLSLPVEELGVGSLSRRQALLVEDLIKAGPVIDHAIAGAWPERLADAICRDLAEEVDHHFLAELDQLLKKTAALGNITAWHSVVAMIRAGSIAHLKRSPQDWLRAENIFERAQILVGEMSERVQGRRVLDKEILVHVLRAMSLMLRAAVDYPAITQALVEHLPRAGVPACYVALPSELLADSQSRMVIAYDVERGSLLDGRELSFRSGDFVPEDLLPRGRHTLIMNLLMFGDESLGLSAIQVGPSDGSFYEALREQLGAAMKGANLFQKVIEEVTKRERADRSRLEGEMQIATRIQTGILPKTRKVAGLELAALMLPATEIGGDYFDILPFPGGCWLGIGDVAGHGLPTGLVMLMIQSIVSATTHCWPDAGPAQVWMAVNAVLHDNVRKRLEQDEHATLTLLRYEPSGRLVFAGAHEDLVVCRAATKRCELIATLGTWAGIVPTFETGESETQLYVGDVLVLHTDGVTEAKDAAGELFGLERLTAALEAVCDKSVLEIRDHLVRTVQSFSSVQFDDLTLVVLRHVGL